MLIYLCSPLRATATRTMDQHLADAHAFARFIVSQGHFPLAPHLILTQYLDDTIPAQRSEGIRLGLEAIFRCEEVWVLVIGGRVSEGMVREMRSARAAGLPLRIFHPDGDGFKRIECDVALLIPTGGKPHA